MATITESFIIPQNLVQNMKIWGDLSWEDIYSEHRKLIQGTLKTDDRVKYLKEIYSKSIMRKVEDLCVESLDKIVADFRADNPEKTEPAEFDWAEFFLNYEKRLPIESKLHDNKELEEAMKTHHKHDTTNISYAISESYNARINDRNNKSYSS